jgi:hypothetical protein
MIDKCELSNCERLATPGTMTLRRPTHPAETVRKPLRPVKFLNGSFPNRPTSAMGTKEASLLSWLEQPCPKGYRAAACGLNVNHEFRMSF